MGYHTVIFGLHNRDDNMTLREEVHKSRQKLWQEMDIEQIGGDLDTVIDRLDDIEATVISKEFDIVTRLSRIEDELNILGERINRIEINISMRAAPAPSDRYLDLWEQMMVIIRDGNKGESKLPEEKHGKN